MQKWTRKPLNGPTLTTPGQTEGHNSEKQFIINKKNPIQLFKYFFRQFSFYLYADNIF